MIFRGQPHAVFKMGIRHLQTLCSLIHQLGKCRFIPGDMLGQCHAGIITD